MHTLPMSEYHIGIVCALPKELVAMVAVLDEEHETIKVKAVQDDNSYTLGKIHQHNVVIACLPAGIYGTNAAATVANNLLRSFSGVRIGLMVGIGGGIPNLPKHDVRLGDVVVSQPDRTHSGVVQYDIGKKFEDGRLERVGALDKPPAILLSALSSLQARHAISNSRVPAYIEEAYRKYPRILDQGYGFPGIERDFLHCARCNSRGWLRTLWQCKLCMNGQIIRDTRSTRGPVFHYGTVASGNLLIKDAILRDRLGHEFDARCVEMEAAGLMNGFRCLVVRGICDYADRHKNDEWQEYAALAAAACAKEILLYVASVDVGDEKPLCELVGILNQQTETAIELLAETRQQNRIAGARYDNSRHQNCHQALKTSLYEDFKNINPERAPNTCKWVTENRVYREWEASQSNNLIWISADPGCGKSVLTRSLVDNELKATEDHKVLYFFFKDNEVQDNLATALCALLHQLFDQLPSLLRHAVPAWDKNGSKLVIDVEELWRVLIAAASDPKAQNVTVVLDALDECHDGDRTRLLQKLTQFYTQTSPAALSTGSTPQESRLKFLVTSRPYDDIQVEFHLPPHLPSIRLRGEDENDQIHKEIDAVIESRVNELSQKLDLSQQTRDRLTTELLQMQNRTYLWLHLAIENIYETLRHSLRPDQEPIEYLPARIEDAYEQILSKVRIDKADEVKMIFQIIIGARRPLTIHEMAIALGIATSSESTTLESCRLEETCLEGLIRRLCGLFVFVNYSKIYLIHQSAKEFLVGEHSVRKTDQVWKHCLDPAEIETVMTEICMEFMMFDDVHEVGKSLCSQINPERRLADDPCQYTGAERFAIYAATYWATHSRHVPIQHDRWFMEQLFMLYDIDNSPYDWWSAIYWNAVKPHAPRPTIIALHLAAGNAHEEIVESLLEDEYTDVDQLDVMGTTALVWAVESGHQAMVKLLLDRGANPNAGENEIGSALCIATANENLEIVNLLLDRGADPSISRTMYGAALQVACGNGDTEMVETLLNRGADIHADAGIRGNALQTASAKGYMSCVRLLIERGAEVNAPGGLYGTALQGAILANHWTTVKFLLDNGADFNATDDYYGSALQAASNRGYLDMIELLLDRGADINTSEGMYGSALYEASAKGRKEIVELILDRGADVNGGRGLASTALYAAATCGQQDIVELLLERGADVHARNGHSYMNPAEDAPAKSYREVIDHLQTIGVEVDYVE